MNKGAAEALTKDGALAGEKPENAGANLLAFLINAHADQTIRRAQKGRCIKGPRTIWVQARDEVKGADLLRGYTSPRWKKDAAKVRDIEPNRSAEDCGDEHAAKAETNPHYPPPCAPRKIDVRDKGK